MNRLEKAVLVTDGNSSLLRCQNDELSLLRSLAAHEAAHIEMKDRHIAFLVRDASDP